MSGRTLAAEALYEHDFFSWTQHQAMLLRTGRFDALDIDNIAEELETLGRAELSTLKSAYRLISLHLLKLIKQSDKATPSWDNTINRERGTIVDLIAENPGLKPKRPEAFAKAYARARQDAAFETRLPLDVFPQEPPFTLDEVESMTFWPQGSPRSTKR